MSQPTLCMWSIGEGISHTDVYTQLFPEAVSFFGQREKSDAIPDFRCAILVVYRLEEENLEEKRREADLRK